MANRTLIGALWHVYRTLTDVYGTENINCCANIRDINNYAFISSTSILFFYKKREILTDSFIQHFNFCSFTKKTLTDSVFRLELTLCCWQKLNSKNSLTDSLFVACNVTFVLWHTWRYMVPVTEMMPWPKLYSDEKETVTCTAPIIVLWHTWRYMSRCYQNDVTKRTYDMSSINCCTLTYVTLHVALWPKWCDEKDAWRA